MALCWILKSLWFLMLNVNIEVLFSRQTRRKKEKKLEWGNYFWIKLLPTTAFEYFITLTLFILRSFVVYNLIKYKIILFFVKEENTK